MCTWPSDLLVPVAVEKHAQCLLSGLCAHDRMSECDGVIMVGNNGHRGSRCWQVTADPLLPVDRSRCGDSLFEGFSRLGNYHPASFHLCILSAWRFGLSLRRIVHDLRHCRADNRLSLHSRLNSRETQ